MIFSYKCVGTYKNQLKKGWEGAKLFIQQAEILTFLTMSRFRMTSQRPY